MAWQGALHVQVRYLIQASDLQYTATTALQDGAAAAHPCRVLWLARIQHCTETDATCVSNARANR
jgi:hypothetical protein